MTAIHNIRKWQSSFIGQTVRRRGLINIITTGLIKGKREKREKKNKSNVTVQ